MTVQNARNSLCLILLKLGFCVLKETSYAVRTSNKVMTFIDLKTNEKFYDGGLRQKNPFLQQHAKMIREQKYANIIPQQYIYTAVMSIQMK